MLFKKRGAWGIEPCIIALAIEGNPASAQKHESFPYEPVSPDLPDLEFFFIETKSLRGKCNLRNRFKRLYIL